MDLKDIKAIIDLMKKNSITEFELERQDSKIRLKRGLNGGAPAAQYDEPAIAMPGSSFASGCDSRPRSRCTSPGGQPVKLTSNLP